MSSSLKNISVAAVLSVVLYSSGMLVIFTPLPLLYVMVVRGRRDGLVAAATASGLMVLIYSIFLGHIGIGFNASMIPLPATGFSGRTATGSIAILGIGYFLFFAAVAVTLGEGTLRKWGMLRLGATSLVTGLIILAVTIAGIWSFGGTDTAASVKDYIGGIVTEVVKINQGTLSQTDSGILAEHASGIAAFITGIAPSLVFVFALLTVAVNLLTGRRIIKKHHAFAHIHNVARFRLPDAMIWAAIATGVAFFADRYALHSGWLETVSINSAIMLGSIYFFQGLAVVIYFIQGIRMPLFKTLAYLAIVLFFQTMGMMMVAIGVADVWADFRLRSWKAKH